jgi:hypothetical protein
MSIEPEQPTSQSHQAWPPQVDPEPPVRPKGRHYIRPIVVGVVFVAVTATWFVIRLQRENQPAPIAADTSYNFQAGQCFDLEETTSTVASTALDCAKSHSAEVYAVEPLSGTTYPGQSTVEALGHRKCPADVAKALTPGMNYAGVTATFLYPLDKQWAQGDRSIKCFFHRKDGLPMTGHVKDSGLPYTPEQKRYRDAVAPYDAILGEQDPAAGWTAEKDVVARSVPVVQQEIAALQAGPWPAELQDTITKLIAAKQMELADRQHAAAAVDEGGFDHDLDAATHDNGAAQDTAVRTQLGLSPR